MIFHSDVILPEGVYIYGIMVYIYILVGGLAPWNFMTSPIGGMMIQSTGVQTHPYGHDMVCDVCISKATMEKSFLKASSSLSSSSFVSYNVVPPQ